MSVSSGGTIGTVWSVRWSGGISITTQLRGRTLVPGSTIQNVDRKLVMHRGKLREIGTHQELMLEQGIYWRLYQMQYEGRDGGMHNLESESRLASSVSPQTEL